MGTRIRFARGKQKIFLETILAKSHLSVEQVATRCGVSPRTLRDWQREKYIGPYETFQALSRDFGVTLPKGKILSPFWYATKGAKLGGKRYVELYGSPGTPEGRKKGGTISQKRRRENPKKYMALGCNVAKEFIVPKHSLELAEFIGIFLGDGGLSRYQARITLSALVDREYAFFTSDIIESVFGVTPSFLEREDENTIVLVVSGVHFADNLEILGLKRGNKIKNQIKIPNWVLNNRQYANACVRGLFDTDGGLYFHKKSSGVYLGWCFSSSSEPLLEDVESVLLKLGLNVKKEQGKKLYLYNLKDISRYMEMIGSHNFKNITKFQSHLAACERKIDGEVLRIG